MIITIDNAGRLVIPKVLREQFNLFPGSKLEIEASAGGMTLRPSDVEPALVRKQGILIHHGSAPSSLDVGAFVRAERDARHARIANDAD